MLSLGSDAIAGTQGAGNKLARVSIGCSALKKESSGDSSSVGQSEDPSSESPTTSEHIT